MYRGGYKTKVGKVILKTNYGNKGSSIKTFFLIPHHHLTNFEIQKHYYKEPRFNGV